MQHKAGPLPYPCPPERPRRASGHEPQGPAGGGGCSRPWLLLLLALLAAWYLTPFALQGPSQGDAAMQDLVFSTGERADRRHHLPAAEELRAALDGRDVATWSV